jgi:hypothetical protein
MLLEKSFKIITKDVDKKKIFVDLVRDLLPIEKKIGITFWRLSNSELVISTLREKYSDKFTCTRNKYVDINNVSPNEFGEIMDKVLSLSESYNEIIFTAYLSDSKGDFPDCIRINYDDKQVINRIWFELNYATPERIAQIQEWVKYPLKYMSQMGDW